MRTLTIALLLTLVAVSAPAAAVADPADEVRKSEIAFASAFAARDRDKFFSMVADDASFLSPRRTLHGKKEIVDGWSSFFDSADRPFSWYPERVAVNGAGTIGLTSGPVLDPKGNQIGVYSSVWNKQPDGSWKIIFDGPGCPH
jgi:ketosteroid isomerase-like protein